MKKLVIPLLIIGLLLAGCAAKSDDTKGTTYTVNTDDVSSLSTDEAQAKLGELYVTQANEEFSPTGDFAVKGTDFTLSKPALDAIVKTKTLSGTTSSVDFAISEFVLYRCLYYYAINNGYSVSNSAVNTALSSKKTYDEAQGTFSTYLSGTGLTSSAYWALYAKQFKITYIANKYKSDLHTQFLSSSEDTSESAWRTYFADVMRKAIDSEQLQYGDGIGWTFKEGDSNFLAMLYVV